MIKIVIQKQTNKNVASGADKAIMITIIYDRRDNGAQTGSTKVLTMIVKKKQMINNNATNDSSNNNNNNNNIIIIIIIMIKQK